MKIEKSKLNGVFFISLLPFHDERGFFMRTYDVKVFVDNGIHRDWVQENHSSSNKKGIVRGLHFQLPPYSETKLVRCIRGAVMDVFIDLRRGSKTFGQWESIELSEENKKMVFIPRGFAHGFCTLTDKSEVMYKVDNYYSPKHELGIIWNDQDLKIKWPVQEPIISEKDKKNLSLSNFTLTYRGVES